MNKRFGFYALIWAIFVAVFNLVVFLVRPVISWPWTAFDGQFWIAWGFVTAAFLLNLAIAFTVFKTKSLMKKFYKIPLITVSSSGLIAMVIAGIILMLIVNCPTWITAVVCIVIFALTLIPVIVTIAAGGIIADVDTKVKENTLFVRALTVDAESLLLRASTPEAKTACKKVFETIRYSDPMSSDALAGVESQITLKFDELSKAVAEGRENIDALADEVVILMGDRNRKCKLLK